MVVGERIKLARHMAGMSQRDVAARAGLSAQAISKYERGLDTPSSGVLIRLGQALGVKPEYFIRPTRVRSITPEYRKHAGLPQKCLDGVLARVRSWLDQYLEIESIVVPEPPTFAWPHGFPYPVASLDDVERATEQLRTAWDLGRAPIEHLIAVLEERGIKVGVIAGAPPGFDACSFRADIDGSVPVIAVSADLPGDRQRFSLAHELGHLALAVAAELDPEKVAHRFASAFLVPAAVARFELGARRQSLDLYELHLLKHQYGLSMQAWIYRARDLGILAPQAAERLFKTFGANGWRKEEPGDPYPPERPTRMERLVLRALADDLISDLRAAELLGMPLEEFRRRAAEEHRGLPAGVGD
jgi:Zn-dependent peptidase ImmA (M78 family)/transcriptional regulator with XRE-family HTH domain